jgi:CRP/FNR family nitrogen fixation transcriptional regulator
VRSFAASDTGQALTGILKNAAKQALPVVGRAVGSYISPRGGDIGARVAQAAGDIFGLELGEEHSCSAEAITDTTVLLVKRTVVLAAADRHHQVARLLWSHTARALVRAQSHTLLLIKSAQERVAAFLLEMAERLAAGSSVELPMSRQDIADYLGLTIETVSRTLSQLEDAATISLPASRRIVLRNRSALSRLND